MAKSNRRKGVAGRRSAEDPDQEGLRRFIHFRGVVLGAIGTLLVALLGNLLWDLYNQPRLRLMLAYQGELHWVEVHGTSVYSRVDTWDMVRQCALLSTLEVVLASVDSLDPVRATLSSYLVLRNSGPREATNVLLAFQVDSIGELFTVSAQSNIPHSLTVDSTPPSLVHGLKGDVDGVRTLRIDRLPSKTAVLITVDQEQNRARSDTIIDSIGPRVGIRVLYLMSTETGSEAQVPQLSGVLETMAAASAAQVLVTKAHSGGGFSGTQLHPQWIRAVKQGDQLGQRACPQPPGFYLDGKEPPSPSILARPD